MAEYSGNDIYLRMNSVNVEARWRSFKPKLAIGDEDVSAGAGVDWEKHAEKLKRVEATITLVYDDVAAATDMAALITSDSVIPVVYGPEGSAAGKLCHNQNFLVTGIDGPTTNHDKTLVTLEYSLIGTGVPTKNIFVGDTF
jgi:hypothetical protein